MVFEGFIKFTGLPESKNGKNSNLKIFDILLNTFETQPLRITCMEMWIVNIIQ